MSTSTELAPLPPKESALQVYATPAGLDPYLQQIKQEIDAFVPDVSSKKGRDAIASIAHKVARSKTALDNIGKELVAELKDVPKKIDAERKRMRDLLDQWKDEVRRPLTEWEEAEQARVEELSSRVQMMREYADEAGDYDAAYLRSRIARLESTPVDQSWQEYEAEGHRVKAATLDALRAALVKREAFDAEQAELARLRAEAAAREQKEREECIAREAAERAQREAEAKAQAEREAITRREQEAKAAAERRELELTLAAERAEREKAEALRREQEAKAEAERKAAEAVEAEKRRVAALAAAEAAEAKRREADKQHKAQVNRAAMQALIDGGVSEDCAKVVITLIAKKAIPAVSITY